MSLSAFIDGLSALQDYLWFLGGLVWGAVLVGTWRTNRLGISMWIQWSALAAVAQSVISLAILVSQVKALPGVPVHPLGDALLAAALSLQAAGWTWLLCPPKIRRTPLALVLLLAAGALVLLQYRAPRWGSWLPVIALLGAAIFLLPRLRGKIAEQWVVGLLALAAALSPVGPVASELNILQRWMELSPMGPFCALLLIAAGAAAAVAAVSPLMSFGDEPGRQRQRDARRYTLGIGIWLVGGLAASVITSRAARTAFEQFAVGRVAAAAALFDTTLLDGPLGAGLKFRAPVTYYPQPNGGVTPVTYSDQVAIDRVAPAMAQLQKIQEADPDVRFVLIETLRAGWSLVAVVPRMPPKQSGLITLLEPIAEHDLERWGSREAYFEGPVTLSYGEIVFARAPLLGRDHRMLGWLTFAFGVGEWAAAQAQARLLTFSVIALGAVLGWLLFLQSLRAREREAALQAAALAEGANRLKTTFLASVSHELRTPIQGILGYAELLQGHIQSEIGRTRIVSLRQNGELMIRLVNDLIDLAALDSGRFGLAEKPVDIGRLIADAVESLRPRAEKKGLRLSLNIDATVPACVNVDPERARQIVINLVANAIKFTESGGVEVRLHHRGDEGDLAQLELSVQDTGPGISAADQAHLFKPFSRLNKTAHREGSGLGLALSAALCRQFEGDLGVESDGRTGSTFRARWRLRVARPVPSAAAPLMANPLSGRRILVADDNAFMRELFVAYLSELGAVCDTACDGTEAIASARAQTYDALVLDLAMPGYEGTEVARALRAAGRGLRIVGVSAHAGTAERDQALAAGMDDFLTKPVDLATLAAALRMGSATTRQIDPWAALHSKWDREFRAVAANEFAQIKSALVTADWPQLFRQAHHMKNNATALRDDRLYSAFDELESAAARGDGPAAVVALSQCEHALIPWLTTAENFQAGTNAGLQQPTIQI